MTERAPLAWKGGTTVDINQLVDDLEEVIGAGWPVPGMGRAMVDLDKATELLERLREHLPRELHMAHELVSQRDNMLEQAEGEAARIIQEAERRALELVNQEGVYKTAERQARALLDQAQQRAADIHARADEYAVESLGALEARLTQTLATVQNGIASLRSRAREAE